MFEHMHHPYRVALVGNPNSGKSSLFNALTGLRQKIANYPGATVERRTGHLKGDETIELIDLPGTYSLSPKSADEDITKRVLEGSFESEAQPDLILYVVDATNLRQHLVFLLELKQLGLPIMVALNMVDMAAREKIEIDVKRLAQEACLPVVETVAVRKKGLEDLIDRLADARENKPVSTCAITAKTLKERQAKARDIAKAATVSESVGHQLTRTLDSILLHRLFGPLILFALFFFMFQAVFAWSATPMDMIEEGVGSLQTTLAATLPDGWLLSLLNDGILSGVGAVIVFLPQILVLFAFILVMESSGYMARAAFIMDRIMGSVGLNGRAFIPLLSSFACAIPGIMAARTIPDPRDRLTTILVAPLITCSARLPVYTMLIAAFIPNIPVLGGFAGLQGLVMFLLFFSGVAMALLVAFILKRTITKGTPIPFVMEMPKYQIPQASYVGLGLWSRTKVFMRRAGTIIFTITILLWVLGSYPVAPEGAENPIQYSIIGIVGGWLAVVFAPIGFNWAISIALIPGMAAREVAIAALGTVYALAGSDDVIAGQLATILPTDWSLATGLSFLVWFIFAPQCLSTIAVTRRETGGWKWPLVMLGYLFGLAYLASFITYQGAVALGWG